MTTGSAIVERATKVDAAARKLREAATDILVVTDGNHKVVGVLTDRDIATRACADRLSAQYTPVSEIMTRNYVSCGPDDVLADAIALMERERVEHVIVTDSRHHLLGMIGLEQLAEATDATAVARVIAGHKGPEPRRSFRTA